MEQSIPNLIYVQDRKGHPLMPTRRHNKVWYWLRKGYAHVVNREPFTIQLSFDTTNYTQPATVGVDTGSTIVGMAATSNGEVVYQAEVHLRTDIAEKVIQRRQYRRNRRSRKTRYRAARWANRRRKAGWLSPALRSKAEATIKAVRFAASILPVGSVNVEIGQFDTQKMQNPQIQGGEYLQGQLQGYLLREYLLEKWGRKCAYCHSQGIPLQIEHLIPKSRGGPSRVSNLAIACKQCNQQKGNQTAEEFGFPEIQAQAGEPLKHAAHTSSIKTVVLQQLRKTFGLDSVTVTYGYETKYKRTQILNLPKSHTNDAIAIACMIGELATPSPIIYQFRCVARGNYRLFNGSHSEHKVWAPRKVKGWKLYEQAAAKGHIGYVGGRRIKGAFVLKSLTTGKTILEVVPSKLLRLARSTHGWIVTMTYPSEGV